MFEYSIFGFLLSLSKVNSKGNFFSTSIKTYLISDSSEPHIRQLINGCKVNSSNLRKDNKPLSFITKELKILREKGNPIEELHLVAHGNTKGIRLGGQLVDKTSIIDQAKELATWQIKK